MSTKARPNLRRPPRWIWVTWGTVLGLLVAVIVAKSADSAWYRHRRADLAVRGQLPSIEAARASARISSLWARGRAEVLSTLGIPLASEVTERGGGHRLTCGDHARDGWDVTLVFDEKDQLIGGGTSHNDFTRIGTPAILSARLHDAAEPAAAIAALVAIVLGITPIGARAWRRSIGGCALVAAVASTILGHLSRLGDRTFLDVRQEPIHWVPIGLVAATAAVTFWPAGRRRAVSGICRACGYDLTGNVSGVCPECGVAISAANKAADDIGGAAPRPAVDRG